MHVTFAHKKYNFDKITAILTLTFQTLVSSIEGLSLPRKSVVRLTDRPDMTLDVYRGRKTIINNNATDIYK